MSIWGYVRVSTEEQSTENQKLAILEYANKEGLIIDHWIEAKASTRRSDRERRLDELKDNVQVGDVIIVAELSRLGRSVGQIAILVDELLKKRIRIICLKEKLELDGKSDLQSKVMVTMFSLFAEIERELISKRTKEGLARAKAEGKVLGRPVGSLGSSKLDGKEDEIRRYIRKGLSKLSIAKIYDVSWPTMNNFIITRGLTK